MSLTRDLHPDRDLTRYEVCWPRLVSCLPVGKTPLPDYSGIVEDYRRRRSASSRAVILAALTTEFQRVPAIAVKVGLTHKTVQAQLWTLERDGKVERVNQPMSYRGRPQRLYRLAASPVGKGQPDR